jgi:hypothetical protein
MSIAAPPKFPSKLRRSGTRAFDPTFTHHAHLAFPRGAHSSCRSYYGAWTLTFERLSIHMSLLPELGASDALKANDFCETIGM